MVDDNDIYRSAKLLIDRDGEEAPSKAARRADELAVAGDISGAAVWKRIKSAAEEMLRVQAGDGQESLSARKRHGMRYAWVWWVIAAAVLLLWMFAT